MFQNLRFRSWANAVKSRVDSPHIAKRKTRLQKMTGALHFLEISA
jgi:hypothetical protein